MLRKNYRLQLYLLLVSGILLVNTLKVQAQSPRPVTICSAANIIIKGDDANGTPTDYLWQYYQAGTWLSAPGLDTDPQYLATSLVNLGTQNVVFNMRRKITVAGLVSYDSYYLVTVQPILPITNNIITSPVLNSFCGSGTSSTILGTLPVSGTSTFSYQWQQSADNKTFINIDDANGKDYSPGQIAETIYLRRVAISGGCGLESISNSIVLTVAPVITSNIITLPPLSVFCTNGDAAAITGNVPTGGNGIYNYQWQKSEDNLTYTDIAGANLINYDPPLLLKKTFYRRNVISGPCNNSASSGAVVIDILPQPSTPLMQNASVTICPGSIAVLSVLNPVAGFTYNWYDSPQKTNFLGKGTSYTTGSLTQNKTYYIESDNGLCVSATMANVQVLLSTQPDANVMAGGNSTTTCSGSVAVFIVPNPKAEIIYKWYSTAAGGVAIATGSTFTTPKLSANTTFYLELVNSDGCSSRVRQAVDAKVMPLLATPIVSVEATTQKSVTFKWTAITGASGYRVSIDKGITYTAPSSGNVGLTHTVSGLNGSETVTIVVKAIGDLSCQESGASIALSGETVKEFGDLYVANAFTPNGDGNNDVAFVHSQTIQTLSFNVYNQWGQQIFYSSNPSNGWDGTYKGNNQPAGVYVYYVKAVMNNGLKVNKKGTITLLR